MGFYFCEQNFIGRALIICINANSFLRYRIERRLQMLEELSGFIYDFFTCHLLNLCWENIFCSSNLSKKMLLKSTKKCCVYA